MKYMVFLYSVFFSGFLLLAVEEDKSEFPKVGSEYIFSDLKEGDSRKKVMEKFRKSGFLQIYEEPIRVWSSAPSGLTISGMNWEPN